MSTHVPPTAAAAVAEVPSRWPLTRILFAMAGTVTLVSVTLAVLVSPWWLLLTAFAGVNQLLFATVGDCGASLVLRRVLRVEQGGTR